jgi:hypothetical protein
MGQVIRDPLVTYIDFARVMVERDYRIQRAANMARVGLRGIRAYGDTAEATLDAAADKLADRYDALGAAGLAAIGKRSAFLDEVAARITDLEGVTAQLTNGGPPLVDSAAPSAVTPQPAPAVPLPTPVTLPSLAEAQRARTIVTVERQFPQPSLSDPRPDVTALRGS